MEKNQKSVENVGQSQSSSSRRVMWKVCEEEEEVFDSVVNYRLVSPSNPDSFNSEQELPRLSKANVSADKKGSVENGATKSSTSLGLCYKPSHESLKELATKRRARIVACWHRLFDRLRIQTSPSLALRYKPSHESLKNPCESANLATADLKLETCFFPPYQTAVVREVAPTFAHRMCIPDETDSCCSGSVELRIPLLKSSKASKVLSVKADPHESTSTYSQIATRNENANAKLKRRNKKTVGSSIGGAGGSSKSASNGSPNRALPTLRQRQQELHHYRVLIEKRRLELLDLKIVRERADALRHEILFHKDLQLKHNQIKSYEDNNSSQA
ncbi:uncharacterized protein LOC117782737 [Drosophila innubila]|uniref:uncharacterized protein LOC117782737 n=1 Tax=Drosophila innubila TaxID=198719 RepID=UPI00148E053E|nr:uncharacterized protein LOC117782737 [Drosophila innubila]